MEKPETRKYEVVITDSAEISFYEILDYLYDNYSIDKAEQMANQLRNIVETLQYQPERGAIENYLSHRPQGYRYILYKRTSRTQIKVIYYIKESTVFITDFFPTEKNPFNLKKGNQ